MLNPVPFVILAFLCLVTWLVTTSVHAVLVAAAMWLGFMIFASFVRG